MRIAVMSPARHKLPIGIQTFAQIMSEDYYYVDKTRFAHRLIEHGKYYSFPNSDPP